MDEKKVIRLQRNVFASEKSDQPKSFRVSKKMNEAIEMAAEFYGYKASGLIVAVLDQYLQGIVDEVPGMKELIESE